VEDLMLKIFVIGGGIVWLVIAVVLLASHAPVAVALTWPAILFLALKVRKLMARHGL
jgi:hypothetical protein